MSGLGGKILLSILAILLPPVAALIVVSYISFKLKLFLKKNYLVVYIGWLYDTFLD